MMDLIKLMSFMPPKEKYVFAVDRSFYGDLSNSKRELF